MEGGSHGFDPTIKEDNAGIKHNEGGELNCIESGGWTDEKHMHYLSSVEQSFVDELNNKYCEELVDGLPRKNKLSRISTDSELFLGKFKMFSKGGLKVMNIGNSGKEYNTNEGQNNDKMLLSNPWIKRWISPKGQRLSGQESILSEMSDQNFRNEEIGAVESNMMFSKKRSRSPTGSDS